MKINYVFIEVLNCYIVYSFCINFIHFQIAPMLTRVVSVCVICLYDIFCNDTVDFPSAM